jgi:hypothetical protein
MIARRSEWSRCGRICVGTMGNTYRHGERRGSKGMDGCPLTILLQRAVLLQNIHMGLAK